MKPSTRLNAAIPALAILITALLLSLLWTGTHQDQMIGTHSSAHESQRARIAIPGAEASSGPTSRQRRSHDQADARINSLLNLKPGEVALIRIPAEGLSRWFESNDQAIGSISAILSKTQTATLLKEIDGEGFRFAAQVGDQGSSEFSLSGSTVRVEITEDHADHSVFRIENFVDGSRRLLTSTTLMKGYATLMHPNGEDSDALLLVIGPETKAPEP